MYRKFYGFEEKPFDLAPDGEFYYLSETHREAIATLRYGVIADKGFLMLTGGVGTGKTTAINSLLQMVKGKVRLCVLNNPKLDTHEFFHYLAKQLNIRYAGNKARFILEFSRLLVICRKKREKVLIIIDEAHVFPIDLMEEVRLLSNHVGEHNVLSIFLIGQPELREVLADPRLLPLRQRIGIHYHLAQLTRSDTGQYIFYRLNKAGAANPALFTERAVDCIHEATKGIPRLINIVCDHALISGFTLELNHIGRDVILKCIEEIKLPHETKLRFSEVSEPSQSTGTAPHVRKKTRVASLIPKKSTDVAGDRQNTRTKAHAPKNAEQALKKRGPVANTRKNPETAEQLLKNPEGAASKAPKVARPTDQVKNDMMIANQVRKSSRVIRKVRKKSEWGELDVQNTRSVGQDHKKSRRPIIALTMAVLAVVIAGVFYYTFLHGLMSLG